MRFWIGALARSRQSFPMAYLWPAAMGIYLLLRRLIDSTELGEVALDEGRPTAGCRRCISDPATGVPTMKPPGVAAVVPPMVKRACAEESQADPTATVTVRSGPSRRHDRFRHRVRRSPASAPS